jgi:hypothetical protein
MLTNSIDLSYNGGTVTLTKIREGNNSSDFRGQVDDTEQLFLSVKHTLPPADGNGESHLCRLDVRHYNSNGFLQRVASAWFVIKTDEGVQYATASQAAVDAMATLASDAAFTAQLINAES